MRVLEEYARFTVWQGACNMIFVDVQSTSIKVSGDTYPINKVLGQAGLKFKFNKDKKEWRGPCSLHALETLQEQSGAILTTCAMDELAAFQKAAQKRAAYLGRKVVA